MRNRDRKIYSNNCTRIGRYVVVAVCVLCLSAILCACATGGTKPPKAHEIVQFNVDINELTAVHSAPCELPEYFVTFGNGEVEPASVAVYSADGSAVGVNDRSFLVSQPIGTKYRAVYFSGKGNNYREHAVTITVTDDAAAPEIAVLNDTVYVGVDAFVSLSAYVRITDDSGVAPSVRYEMTLNGETREYRGGGFVAEEGVYIIDMRAMDKSGNLSDEKRITIVARASHVIADFETEQDIRSEYNITGVRVQGAAAPTLSAYAAHGGNRALLLDNSAGNALTKVVPFNQHGDTNTIRIGRNDIIGMWYFFLPKDESGYINMHFETPPLWDPLSYGDMQFYLDGTYYQGGSAEGGLEVRLPTQEWIYVQFDVKSPDINFYIGCYPIGYTDRSFTAYVDDITRGFVTDFDVSEYTLDLGDDESKSIRLQELIPAQINNYNVNYARMDANYRLFGDDGLEIFADRQNRYIVTEGMYRAYLANDSGEYTGIYCTLRVTKDVFANVRFDMGENTQPPDGETGTPYPLFEVGGDEAVRYETAVYFNHGGADEAEYDVENGSFHPDRVGIYTLVYTLSKGSESTERSFDIMVTDDAPDLVTNFDALEKKTTCFVGERFDIPTISVFGGTGVVSSTVEIHQEGAPTERVENKVVFETAGVYTVKYIVKDWLTRLECAYDVIVTVGDVPICADEAFLPRYFVSGASYEVDALDAILYTDVGTPETVNTDIFWRYGGVETPIENGRFMPIVDRNCDTVEILYKAHGEMVKHYVVPVVIIDSDASNASVNALNNFWTDHATVTSVDNGVLLSSKQNGNNTAIVAPMMLNNFSLDIAVPKTNADGEIVTDGDSHNKLNAFTIMLTDYKESSVSVALRIRRTNSGAILSYDGIEHKIAGSFNGGNFRLVYDALRARFTDSADNVVANIGEMSKRFTSGLVYVDIKLSSDETGDMKQFIVRSVNGQNFSKTSDEYRDRLAPSLYVESYDIVNPLGNVFTLPYAFVSDFYDPNAKLTVRVTIGDKVVTAIDGTQLNYVEYDRYSFTLSETGAYMILFTTEDKYGNTLGFRYAVWVLEDVDYTIVLDGSLPTEVKVGDTIKLPTARVEGNAEAQVHVYVRDPSHADTKATDQVKFSQKGAYTIVYYAVDANNNSITKSFTIKAV